ncbi:hydantoinase/oxoprolinase family protein [Chloroflexota bacterium]
MGYRIGIDVGGTFTDFLLVDGDGNQKIFKTQSIPEDPSQGVLNGLTEIASRESITLKDLLPNVEIIVHGTTITTNAVITRTYAKTGFITTGGFRDYLNERRGMKRTTYEPFESPPEPIVPRYLIQGVEERVDCEGNEVTPLKEEDVYSAVEVFKKEKVEAVAVSFFFSFLNPAHERKTKEILEKALPGVYTSISSDVLPQVRVYERASTTVFNACVGPILRRYVDSLMRRLKKDGFDGIFLLMQSNGGVMSPEVAMEYAVNTLLSGPAGGPPAAMFFGGIHGVKDIITVDMGGTSFDICLIRNMKPEITVENEVAEYRMAMPSLAILPIGAGGGSIAWIDRGGILRVGPQSAGANPGPACYGAGGVEPTVTDADLILGYLNADYFLGGRMEIYPYRAEKAIMEKIAQPLGFDIMAAASGIYTIVNTNMVQGVRMASVAKGYDPRGAMLVTAGGAGPVHACDIAKELEMALILVPGSSSVFCATGMLISNLRHDLSRVAYMLMKEGHINLDLINSLFREMKQIGFNTLEREGIAPENMRFSYACDLRYEAQFNEIEVPVPMSGDSFTLEKLPELFKAFDRKHDELYGYSLSGSTLELLCLRLVAEGLTEGLRLSELPYMCEGSSFAIKAERKIYHNKQSLMVPVYDGNLVGHGHNIKGPAVIEQPNTTILLTADYDLACDKYGNYLIHSKGKSLAEVIDTLKK